MVFITNCVFRFNWVSAAMTSPKKQGASFECLKQQMPEHQHRCHFVKARVRAHRCPSRVLADVVKQNRKLQAVAHTELLENGSEMCFDGAFGDTEITGDFLVAFSASNA